MKHLEEFVLGDLICANKKETVWFSFKYIFVKLKNSVFVSTGIYLVLNSLRNGLNRLLLNKTHSRQILKKLAWVNRSKFFLTRSNICGK